MSEIWKPVVGFEGFYEISDFGRMRGLRRRIKTGHGWRDLPERFLSACPDNGGYFTVNFSVNGKRQTRRIHQLVLEAFKGQCPANCEARHRDGNKSNNMIRQPLMGYPP